MTSIRRDLLLSLTGAVLLAGFIAALAVYHKAQDEVGALLDYQMRQMALAVRDDAFDGYGVIQPPPYGFDYAIQIYSADGAQLYYSRSRLRLPPLAAAGFRTVDTPEGLWRLYTLHARGVSVQVGQPAHVRDQLAASAAWRTMAPFILLIPLLAALVWLAVTRGLKPLQAVAQAVKSRSARSLDPLPDEDVPQEIRPVVLALNELLPRLSRALTVQRQFVADAAHELRTPLAALRLQLQLAERAQGEAERAAAFDALRQGLDRTTHVVEQLLTLAREEPAAANVARENFDLGALAAEVVALYAPIAERKAIDLGLAHRDASASVRAEREAIRTVISNLVDNAVRYTPAGGRVDVRVLRGEAATALEVSDTGPGIPPEERGRVFDRFYRRADSDVPGSGLGLAIVRSIVERHGAAIELDSGPGGRGLTARVRFPRS
jgi:two-component system OmpR family sensor kinase